MSRIEGVPEREASLLVRVVYRLARHEITKMTGQEGRLTGDIPIRAHRPRMLIGYGMLEKAIASKPRVHERLRALAVLKSAVMQGCEMCQDIGSHEARSAGISDEQLLDLHRYRDSEHFDHTERLVLDLEYFRRQYRHSLAHRVSPLQTVAGLTPARGVRLQID